MSDSKSVLFVCVENAGRSQMAEAFFKKYCESSKFNAISAGTVPVSKINPLVVEVMAEIGIDMNDHFPKILSEQMLETSFMSVNMGCIDEESCPFTFTSDMVDWNISDPKDKPITQVRNIRDQIENKVITLIDSLDFS